MSDTRIVCDEPENSSGKCHNKHGVHVQANSGYGGERDSHRKRIGASTGKENLRAPFLAILCVGSRWRDVSHSFGTGSVPFVRLVCRAVR